METERSTGKGGAVGDFEVETEFEAFEGLPLPSQGRTRECKWFPRVELEDQKGAEPPSPTKKVNRA